MSHCQFYYHQDIKEADLSRQLDCLVRNGYTISSLPFPVPLRTLPTPKADVTVFVVGPSVDEQGDKEITEVSSYLSEWFQNQLFIVVHVGRDKTPSDFAGNGILTSNLREWCGDLIGDVEWAAICRIHSDLLTKKDEAARILKQEQEKQQERVEKNAGVFVQDALRDLLDREQHFRRLGTAWYWVGYATLLMGFFVALLGGGMSAHAMSLQAAKGGASWGDFAFAIFRGLALLGLVVAATKYSFDLGKASLSESLRNADRRHAINFGKFYLSAYGETATWPEIKEAFAQWNIDKPSVFAELKSTDYDPKIIDAMMGAFKIIAEKAERAK